MSDPGGPAGGSAPSRPARAVVASSAAALTVAVYAAADLVRGSYPWGSHSRNIGDLGQQYVPLYAHFRDVLTGSAHGDLLFNWSSGHGVPFLSDVGAYLGTTLSWLVVLFPWDRIDLALYVIFLLATALAAAAMAVYLQVLRPGGPLWLAALGGLSYGASAWSAENGYMLVWLNGLIAFPVLCALGEWLLTRRSLLSIAIAPPVVALLWTSHFYTVYMATIGAGIVTVTRALTLTTPLRSRILGLLRAAIALGVGIGLAAPLLVPTWFALRDATPSPGVVFHPGTAAMYAAGLLSGSIAVSRAPTIAVGTLMLALAATFVVNSRIALRERLVWTTVLGLTVLSTVVPLGHEVWHGFDSPNGNGYRQVFVICGMLVVLGWMSAAAGLSPGPPAVAAAAVLALYGLAVARRAPDVTATTRWLVPAAVAALGVLGIALHRWGRSRPALRSCLVVAVAALVGAELVVSTVAVDDARAVAFRAAPVLGTPAARVRDLVRSADDWPVGRTTPGHLLTVNDPLLVGGEGGEYYSSSIPEQVTTTLAGLGWGYSAYGRALVDPATPVTDALFGVTHRLVTVGRGSQARLRLDSHPAFPVVTIRTRTEATAVPGVFGAQENALGAALYDVPPVSVTSDGNVRVGTGASGAHLLAPTGSGPAAEVTVSATCTPNSELYLDAPAFVGAYRAGPAWVAALPSGTALPGIYLALPLRRLGTVPADGRVELRLRPDAATGFPARPLGCLRPGALAAALARIDRGPQPRLTVGGHGFRVQLPDGAGGTLVMSTVGVSGWQCSTGAGRSLTPSSLSGLLAVPLAEGTGSVGCSYVPPGLHLGLGTGVLVLIIYLGMLVVVLRRGRPREAAPSRMAGGTPARPAAETGQVL